MRTTIRFDDALLREAKQVAAESGRTLTAIIEDALREALARRSEAPQRERIQLPVVKGGRLMPGVDLDNSAALLDLMEAGDDPSGR
jgi:hypothetical protein